MKLNRFWKWTLRILAGLGVIYVVLHVTVIGPALKDFELGMCQTYFAEDPECIRKLHEAGRLPHPPNPEN